MLQHRQNHFLLWSPLHMSDDATNTQHDQWNQPAVRVTAKDAMIMLVGAGFSPVHFALLVHKL